MPYNCDIDCVSARNKLYNLLARIHGDGGHYTANHGLEKSFADADLSVARNNGKLDSLVSQITKLRTALERIADWRGTVTGEVVSLARTALVTVPSKGHEACNFPCPECDPNMFVSGGK